MQNYVVPAIYSDMSNQAEGYFAFRFTCEQCRWQVDTRPIRSTSSNMSAALDIGAGLLHGFLGRAAEVGEQVYGTQWHREQLDALQRSWAEIQSQFRFCPQCHRTVCLRCFNQQRTLCTTCAPDLQADAMHYQHQMDVEAQHAYIQENYHPAFNHAVAAGNPPVPVIGQGVQQPFMPQPQLSAGAQGQYAPQGIQPISPIPPLSPIQPIQPIQASVSPQNAQLQSVACPTCQYMGPPGKFCQECGTKLPMPTRSCPSCSATVDSSAKFCAECGTRL